MSLDPNSSYYDEGGIETIEVIKAKLTPEEFNGFCKGNAIKYLCRSNFKGTEKRDLEKANVYTSLLTDNSLVGTDG